MNEFESDPKVIDHYVQLYRSGDPDRMQKASEFFYRQLNRYVYDLAWEHYPTFMASKGDDLIQCGWIGVMEAIDRYDPYTYAMTTHFKPYILKQMSLFICNASSQHLAQNLSMLIRVQDADMLNRNELSQKSGLSRSSVENATSHLYIQNAVGLDEIDGILTDENPENQPEQVLLKEEWETAFRSKLRQLLSESEYNYLCRRFKLPRNSPDNETDGAYRAGVERKILLQLRSSKAIQQLAGQYCTN